jgi:hypothetical protein
MKAVHRRLASCANSHMETHRPTRLQAILLFDAEVFSRVWDKLSELGLPGFGNKPVSDSTNCEQVLRLGRIVFDVPSQSHDKVIDGAGVRVFA